jgi:hypothetical protein
MNRWCEVAGITSPSLQAVARHPEANVFALLIVALLERGEPMTLPAVAERFEEAGIGLRPNALLSLQRCRPNRPPLYRDGDLYHLDPHDDELRMWLLRLGLREVEHRPRVARELPPLSGTDVPLSAAELDEAWKDASLYGWSAQRIVIAILDAHGDPLPPATVVAEVARRTERHMLDEGSARFQRRESMVDVLADGRWAIATNAAETVAKTRAAVRERLALVRRYAPNPAALAEVIAEWKKERAARGAELVRMSRALLVTYPTKEPVVAALLDVGRHEITSFFGAGIAELPSRLAAYDIIGAIDVRRRLRPLGFDPGVRRLAELGPPQKTKKLNRRGRTLKITIALLVQGSCGISRPFGDEGKLAGYLANGELTKLQRRLEADVKALYALYEYGRLHGFLRLRWGFLDEQIHAPWADSAGPKLHDLKKSALAANVPLEVVAGSAPGWSDPWSRARIAYVEKDGSGWQSWLVDAEGFVIDELQVQSARLAVTVH